MTPTDEQVEAVAKAMAENDGYPWAECSGVQREEYEDNAHAAIAAYKPTVAQAAQVLLGAMNNGLDAFDVDGPNELEGLAIKWAGNRGDGVVQLEIAEEFMREALRALTEPQQEDAT